MTYEWLFAFVTFAEHRNFTKAAAQLHLSQPALHVQIKKLAEAVGRALYVRSGRALVLTSEGERLAAYGREVLDRGERVLAELRGETAAGPVVLAAGQGAFLYLLGPAIRRFPKQRWPLRLLALTGPEAIDAVRSARAHLGVVATDAPPADLASTPLRSVGQHVIVPASHRLARRRTVTPRDLAGEAIVVAPVGSQHRMMLAQALRVAHADWSVAVEANGWELMLHFAKSGMGITVVNDFCSVPRGMVGIPLDNVPAITYRLVAREPLHAAAQAMATLVKEC
jgi:DNA-binding transcriptional LysR family regulator